MALQISRIYLFTLFMGFIVVIMTLSHAAVVHDAGFRKKVDTRASIETTARAWSSCLQNCLNHYEADVNYCNSGGRDVIVGCDLGAASRMFTCLRGC